MLQLLHRPAESSAAFTPFAKVATLADALDELALPVRLRPHHGDLVRVVGGRTDKLYVFDAARSSFVEVPRPRGEKPWVVRWEGDEANAEAMVWACRNVDRRRVVLAACDCAETVLRYVPAADDGPRIAIETARRWVWGTATWQDVRIAALFQIDDDDRGAYRYAARAAQAAASTVNAKYISAEDYASGAASVAANVAISVVADASIAVARATAPRDPFDIVYDRARRSMAPLVRRHIPLSVLACSLVGAADPIPMQLDSPRDGTRERRKPNRWAVQQYRGSPPSGPLVGGFDRIGRWRPSKDALDAREVMALGAFLDTDAATAFLRGRVWRMEGHDVRARLYDAPDGLTLDVSTPSGLASLREFHRAALDDVKDGGDYAAAVTRRLKGAGFRYVYGGGYMNERGELLALYPEDLKLLRDLDMPRKGNPGGRLPATVKPNRSRASDAAMGRITGGRRGR